ncbi:VOC family protein [Prauserella cavernicola]|nr:VOC family protein [Prauserella cavernicola]
MLGATRAEHQSDPRWRVLLDPAGHPFCITTVTPPAEVLESVYAG